MANENNRKIMRGDIFWLNKNLSINLGDNIQFLDRPYVVISNNINNNNDKSPIVNVACLTKQTNKSKYPMHVFISGKKYNLDYDSVICVEQTITINKNELKDKIDTLDEKDLERLNKAIYIQFINEKGNISL